MTRASRSQLKRAAAQIHHGLDRVMQDTLELKAVFDPQHPELSVALQAIMEAAMMAQEILDKFCQAAWGRGTPNYDDWK